MCSEESGAPGSAGMLSITVLVSTPITPTAMPPSLARPVTTVWAHPLLASRQELQSKRPLCHASRPGLAEWEGSPAIAARGSNLAPASRVSCPLSILSALWVLLF